MTQNHRLAQAHCAKAAMVEIVQIRPANPASAQRNLHLARRGIGRFTGAKAQIARAMHE
jgi:hypothetical protein